MERFVRKRKGTIVPFDRNRIQTAIEKAFNATGIKDDRTVAKATDIVVDKLERDFFRYGSIPHVEQIQDIVENTLMTLGCTEVAKAYILYREKRRQIRELRDAEVDAISLIDDYLQQVDWRVRENSNMTYSLQGLNFHISSSIVARYWLHRIYPERVRLAHINGDVHVHDLNSLSCYCNGWDLYDLLLRGFGGVHGKVESKPPKHFRTALGQLVNFMYTLQGECYSADTQVLTESGWKYFWNVSINDRIYTLNPETRQIELQKPIKLYEFNYDGELYHFEGDGFDLLVTPNHNMLVCDDSRRLTFIKAHEFGHEHSILCCTNGEIDKQSYSKASIIEKVPYKGKVYCLEVPNHTLCVRRNGKICWCGNSAGAVAVSNIDTLLAPFIRYDGLNYEQVKQAIQEFIFNMNVPTRVGFQTPFTNTTHDLVPPPTLKDNAVIIGGEPQDATYGEFQEEMNMFNRAFFEVMAEGDAKGRPFSFPIPTINITRDFDFNNPNLDPLWEATRRFGTPYWANYVNSDMKPEDARSMCLAPSTCVMIKDDKDEIHVGRIYELYNKFAGCSIEVPYNGQWVPARFVKVPYKQPFYRVKLSNGISLDFTADHKHVTIDGIKLTTELQPGDCLAWSTEITPWNGQVGDFVYGYKLAKEKGCLKHWFKLSTDALVGFLTYILTENNGAYGTYDKNQALRVGYIANVFGYSYKIVRIKIRRENGEEKDFWVTRIYRNDRYVFEDKDRFGYVKIVSIEKIRNRSGKAYCFEVYTNDHLFELPCGLITHNCCRLRLDNRELRKRGGGLFASAPLTGSINVVTINMPRIAYLSHSEKDFFERLEQVMEIAKLCHEVKRKVLEDFTEKGLYPYSCVYLDTIKQRTGSYWSNHFSTIGIVGMHEACLNFLGKPIYDPEAKKWCIKVLEFMREKILEFQEETGNLYNLEATPAESCCYRLAKIDKKKYPGIITSGTEEAPYYTNSVHLPVGYTDDIFEILEHQDDLMVLFTGGCVVHLFVGEEIPSVEVVKELVKSICWNFRLPYFSITPTFSICPIHGYIPGKHEFCPYPHTEKQLAKWGVEVEIDE